MTEAEEFRVHGRVLRPRQTEVKIDGQRGRFTYLGLSTSTSGDVSLAFYGGKPGHEKVRSFRPERVKIVHTKQTTRNGSTRR